MNTLKFFYSILFVEYYNAKSHNFFKLQMQTDDLNIPYSYEAMP